MKKIKANSSIKENAGLEFQIQEQIRAYRNARNLGDLRGMENTISALRDILWAWIPKEDKYSYLEVIYVPKGLSEFYTDDDREELRKYGELDDDRILDIRRRQNQYNRREFYKACENRIDIIMEVVKKRDLGLKEDDEAEISHIKKK